MRRRAWIYVLSVAALLGPAAGIAYLGAVSYRDERSAVTALGERHREAAFAIVERLDRAIVDALDAVERGVAQHGAPDAPLARYWFWIDADQKLRAPQPAPTGVEVGGSLERTVGCEGLRASACEREQRLRGERVKALQAAQRAEATESWAEARKLYTQASVAETEPEALLGLARVNARLGDTAHAAQALGDLERKYGDRVYEGVSMRLVVAILRAQAAGPDGLFEIAENVLADRYKLDPVARLGVLARIRRGLDGKLTDAQAQRRAAIDERIAAIRVEARAAAGLADDVAELSRNATTAWRGKPAAREPQRTLVYRRRADGGVIGISVDGPLLEQVVGSDLAEPVAAHAQPLVLAAGATSGPRLRTIVQVPLGAQLPHLSLAIVNPARDSDPFDAVIRERSRRHVVYTSALAIALGLGLLALIRGAARARELAQLKSDFVSTVSHELKTPLTSIRMFAEMLEQGVARGDTAKMARYHSVIVQESQRLGILIANLLDYAQIERGTRRYAPSRLELAQLARHAVATFETLQNPESGRNTIEVAVSPEAAHAEVEADRDVVVQAVLNLLANAVKYGRASDDASASDPGAPVRIDVTVGADATHAWLAVRDYGPGIAQSEQARVFREFYRAPEAYRSGVEGTGLGLALVKRHVEALGGTVALDSSVGKGATFTIRLPRAGADAGKGDG